MKNFKIVLVGDSNSGKTALFNRFADKNFTNDYITTITNDCYVKNIKSDYKIQFWDTAGQERFRVLPPMYYKGTHAIILVYDVSCRQSYLEIDKWLIEIDKFVERDKIILLLVGNKSDIDHISDSDNNDFKDKDKDNNDDSWIILEKENKTRQVSTAEGFALAEKIGCFFMETSAKTGQNVTEVLNFLINKIIQLHTDAHTDSNVGDVGDIDEKNITNNSENVGSFIYTTASGIIGRITDLGEYIGYTKYPQYNAKENNLNINEWQNKYFNVTTSYCWLL